MYLDYSQLEFDVYNNPETPELLLKTLAEESIGVIPNVSDLSIHVKFSEPSELSFQVSKALNDDTNIVYDKLTGYKLIYTKHYGIYMVMNPSIETDGISETKTIKAYSIEKTLDTKKFFLEEGTYKFYNVTNAKDPNTIIGRILEKAVGWSIGYISPSLAQKYRTFDQYDEYLLSFIYNTAPDKYLCVFVFDPYSRTINAYDAEEEVPRIPIYLDFDNLVTSLDVEEITDELVTAISPYGADELDIREINPTGNNWIYDLSYFISNGDISRYLAEKWELWQRSVLNNRELYRGLISLRASVTSNIFISQADLTELEGELETLEVQQNITIQAYANETTSSGKEYQQDLLDEINAKIVVVKDKIAAQEKHIKTLQEELDADNPTSYNGQISSIIEKLSLDKFFSEEEYNVLTAYMIEQDVTESTFVASDLNTEVSGDMYRLSSDAMVVEDSDINRIVLSDFNKSMYSFAGGTFSTSDNIDLTCDIIRGTLEVNSSSSYVFSIYAGTIVVDGVSSPSGLITITGEISSIDDDIAATIEDGVEFFKGTYLNFDSTAGSLYLSANVSEYQKYSVKMELYDYAVGVLADVATPTYEFSINSGNFIFANEFEPYRNALELGKQIYLRIDDQTVINPYIIEFQISFEDRSDFTILFSNRFKRHDQCNTLKDMIEQGYSSGKSFDAGKYIYNQAASQMPSVSEFMQGSLDAAKNTILGAANQTVVIDGAGIHIGGTSNNQMRIVDSMLAFTNDNWATAKLAIGQFYSEEVGNYFGVNAEVIGGKLIVGNNLVIENSTDEGVMQFKVDSTGAWLNNSTMVLQKDNAGKLIIDPKYGIVAGRNNLFTIDGTTVTPTFIDEDGNIVLDEDGIPENANFYLDMRDGSAYFRGKLAATSGDIGGFKVDSDKLWTGSGSNYIALNGSGSNEHSAYAIWAGGETPAQAKFYVKKDGTLFARDGIFSGTLEASRLVGNLVADDGGWLIGTGINVGDGNFYVTPEGDVTMKGGISLTGNITWGAGSAPTKVLYSQRELVTPSGDYDRYPTTSTSNWHKTFDPVRDYYASYTYDGGNTWTAATKIQASDGTNGLPGTDATVDRESIFNVLTSGGTKYGLFYDISGDLYLNANYIRAGDINADRITLSSHWGGFTCKEGDDGVNITKGAMMYGGDSTDIYLITTTAGVRMQAIGTYFYVIDGAIAASTSISVTSDERNKKEISSMDDRYDSFYMNLNPKYYKYKDGKSNRYHVGFVAQEVEQALVDSGLTTQDFAGFVRENNPRTDRSVNPYQCYLRYDEFIGLNTHMIQKLYRRIEDLENRLNERE